MKTKQVQKGHRETKLEKLYQNTYEEVSVQDKKDYRSDAHNGGHS